jgi:hypothetical protein
VGRVGGNGEVEGVAGTGVGHLLGTIPNSYL